MGESVKCVYCKTRNGTVEEGGQFCGGYWMACKSCVKKNEEYRGWFDSHIKEVMKSQPKKET